MFLTTTRVNYALPKTRAVHLQTYAPHRSFYMTGLGLFTHKLFTNAGYNIARIRRAYYIKTQEILKI
jgi:hypothetical protein